MTPKETKNVLMKQGIRLDIARRSKACVEEFCIQMDGRRYGAKETLRAFQWFECGW